MTKIRSNYQDLLKIIAITAMVIDHIGLYFLPDIDVLRVIGRIAMPLFCFFAGYNFRGRIRFNILIYGIIIQLFLSLMFGWFIEANILIPIFLGQIYLKLFEQKLQNFWFGYFNVIIFGCFWVFTYMILDYGTIVLSIMILGYLVKYNPNLKLPLTIAIVAISFIHTFFTFVQFDYNHIIYVLIAECIVFVLLNIKSYDAPVKLALSALSRKSLEFYSLQYLVLLIIFYAIRIN